LGLFVGVSVLVGLLVLSAAGALGGYTGTCGCEYTRREELSPAQKAAIMAGFAGYHGALFGLVFGLLVGGIRRWRASR
jgi:hypothetical protein